MNTLKLFEVEGPRAAQDIAGKLVPFRAPHHSSTPQGLAQEFHLAAGGVLYLDEIGEFPRQSIETLTLRIHHNYPQPPLAIVIDTRVPYHLKPLESRAMARRRYEEAVQAAKRALEQAIKRVKEECDG